MKAYVVTKYRADDMDIIGVFSKLELAEHKKQKLEESKQFDSIYYDTEEYEVYEE